MNASATAGGVAAPARHAHAPRTEHTAVRAQGAGGAPLTYNSLNVVRVVLGFAVLLYHLGATIALDKYFAFATFEAVFGFGGARVPFFFVLSGFLLTLVYSCDFGRPEKVGSFLWRRFLRVYPTYWIVLLLVMGSGWVLPSVRATLPDDTSVLLKTFLLLPQPASAGAPTGAPVIIAAWTLHYEMVAYVLLAAWIWSRPLGVVLCMAMLANAAACSQWQCGFYNTFLAGSSFLYFAYGAAAARLALQLPPLPHARALVWIAACAYLCIAVITHGYYEAGSLSDPSMYYGMLASIILVCLTRTEAMRPARRPSKWIKLLSDSSYAMYLMHFPVISGVCRVVAHFGLQGVAGAWVAFAASVVCCVAAAVSLHLLIERRLSAWRA